MTISIKKIAAVMLSACMAMSGMSFSTSASNDEKEADFSDLGAVGVFSAAEAQLIAERIYDGLKNHEEMIDLTEEGLPVITADELSKGSLFRLYQTVVCGWDAGILTKRNYMMSYKDSERILCIAPTYLVEENYEAEYARMMGLLDQATAGVNENWSSVEKALYLHNWVTEEFYYTSANDTTDKDLQYTAYGLLKNGHGVCEGYAWLYALLMNRVGVNCQMILSEEANHSWNIVKIDGDWYHVDLTRADNLSKHPGVVDYSRFLKSRRAFRKTGITSSDWRLASGVEESSLSSGDRYDDAFWNNAVTSINPIGEHSWLAVLPDENDIYTNWITRCDYNPETGEFTQERLNSWSSNGSEIFNVYIVPTVRNDIAFYCTHKDIFFLYQNQPIWLAGLSNDEVEKYGYIYGMKLRGDKLYYYLSPIIFAAPTEFVLDLSAYDEYINAQIANMNAQTTTPTEETTTTTEETTTTTTTTTTESTTTTTTTTTTESTTTTTTTTTTEPTTTTTTTTTTESTTTTTTTTTTEPTTTTTTTTTTESTTTTTTTTMTSTTTTTTTTTEATTTTTTAPTFSKVFGDADGDGMIGIVDVITVQKYLLGAEMLDKQSKINVDLTDDGQVNAFDLAMLKRMLIFDYV